MPVSKPTSATRHLAQQHGCRRSFKRRRQLRGFTLLEVLVALIVISVGLTAAIISSIEITRNSLHLRDKTFALWVAQNILNDRQVHLLDLDKQPTSGNVSMADEQWYWQVNSQTTEIEGVQRTQVIVSKHDQVFIRLESYERIGGSLE